MDNKEKLEALKRFLAENGIKYLENHQSKMKVMMDLKVPGFMIAVHLSDDHDQEFYNKVKRVYKPFYIRESEKVDFIIEKMQNCIRDVMVLRQKQFEREQRKQEAVAAPVKPKRKRVMIPRAEKV